MKKALRVLIAIALAFTSIAMPFNYVLAISDDISSETVVSESESKNIAGNADIVFVIDSTGSMESYIASVKENLTNFVNYLSSKGVSLNMSVIEYRDIEKDGEDSTICHAIDGSNWTSDVKKVIDVFDSISVDGGGDTPETPIDAFEKIGMIDFPREDASKFIFLLTDADYKDYADTEENRSNGHYNMNQWTEIFRDNNIKVTVVSQTTYEDEYNYLYTLTGGRFIDINSKDYYELMQEYSEWIYENAIDSDGDGLPDDWEINGVDTDRDGVIDLDLKAMGADPNVPDIFVEADWMEYEGDDFDFLWIHEKRNQKNTAPSAWALKMVYDQFKSHGINIHIDAGPDSIMNYDTGETWGGLSGASALTYQEILYLGNSYENWNQMAIDNFTRARWTTFRYCLFVNQYDAGNGNRSSGIAENIPGQFFIVASGCIGGSDYDTALAGTFMHELGHTLGLSHGGLYYDSNTNNVINDHNHFKRNHLSVMNYTYQFSGLRTVPGDYICNYQDFNLPEIDEHHVNENLGIDPKGVTEHSGLTIKIPVKNKFFIWDINGEEDSSIARQPIDFNQNGILEADIECHLDKEPDQVTEIIGTLHETLNEWQHLKFTGALIGGYGDEINVDEISMLIIKPDNADELNEISVDEAFEMGLLGNPGECRFNDTVSKILFSEQKDQHLTLTISNLYPEATNVKLNVKSDILSTEYINDVDVSKDGATVEVPVNDNLDSGSYNISYSMTLANGEVVTETGTINVVAPDATTMNIGDTEPIPVDSVISCESSDNSIVEITDGKIIAKSKGTAYVTVTFDSNDIYCARITVLGNGGEIGGWIIALVVILILIILGGIVGIIVYQKRKRKGETETEPRLNYEEGLQDDSINSHSNEITEEAANTSGVIQVTSGSMNGFSVPIKDGETLYLGKDAKFANLVFTGDYKNVSRLHCAVTFDAKANRYFVTDCSTNGTYFINQKRLEKGKRTPVAPTTTLLLANDNCMIRLE